MSHGTMKYTLKTDVCYFVLMVGLLHYLYSLHPDFYSSENIINRDLMGNFFNKGLKFLKLIARVRINHQKKNSYKSSFQINNFSLS
jgi:hypothetical protein